MQIKVVPARVPLISKKNKRDIGDLILEWEKPFAIQYLGAPPKVVKGQILPLRLLEPNPWKALEALAISAPEIKAPYKCPYTGYEFFAIIPAALISDDLKNKYTHVHHWNKEYLFDHEWHREVFRNDVTSMGEIGKLMFGSGWTTGTGINDGSREIIETVIDLDNDDKLFAYTWKWYNK